MSTPSSPCPVVVLISGSGSNLQALIDSPFHNESYRIAGVISNRADAKGLLRAKKQNIPTQVLSHKSYSSREEYDQALMNIIDRWQPVLVILAGFMRILSPVFVQHYMGRMLNIHPSLLPDYQGLHTHQRALDANESMHGASVHFVTEELDGGPVIIQAKVPVLADDSEQSLADRVLEKEHIIFPKAVNWFVKNELKLEVGKVYFRDEWLQDPMIL